MSHRRRAEPTCVLRLLPPEFHMEAAAAAAVENPANVPCMELLPPAVADVLAEPQNLAVLTSKYWGANGVKLGVSFVDNPPVELRDRILSHMNAWSEWANVSFSWSQSGGQVRITRSALGYWSYLGVDIMLVPKDQPTMCFQDFSMSTPEAEYHRVVRHEAGHTLGFPHEHLRRALIAQLDQTKTIAYFHDKYGWNESITRANVLTPVEESSLMGTVVADQDSIMCYQIDGACTVDGKPIRGGSDIDVSDQAFAARLYPKAVTPPTAVRITVPRAGVYELMST